MSQTEGTSDEDVSHIVVRGDLSAVAAAVEGCLAALGYKRVGLRGQTHLLKKVDWASPFSPPPEYRCLKLLDLGPGFVSVVDELDRTDWNLALGIAERLPSWVFRGWRELTRFEWSSPTKRNGVAPPALSAESMGLLRLSYDDVGLVVKAGAQMVLGYSRGRPYPLDPRGAEQ